MLLQSTPKCEKKHADFRRRFDFDWQISAIFHNFVVFLKFTYQKFDTNDP